jgi:outer membrane protein OmpA-like peptidoglycan-associated protein
VTSSVLRLSAAAALVASLSAATTIAAAGSASKPVHVGIVYFNVDSAALTPAAKTTLTALVPKLSSYSSLTLTGYI